MSAPIRCMIALIGCVCYAHCMKVGALYEGWHAFAVDAIRNISNTTGGIVLTVEDVIRSNGTYSMYDMLDKYGLQPASDNFYYQAEPEAGFYCLYTHRANETGYIPDCLNVTGTLTRHANELTQAGVDFIAMDSTNLPVLDREADVIQVRPQEVLFETWSALRAQNISTPYIASWQTIPAGGTLWQNALVLYNTYPDLVYTDANTGKMVFFVPKAGQSPDPSIQAQIESNGGKNNIVVVPMWAEFGTEEFSQGLWAFFSPCTVPDSTGQPEYTTNVVGLNSGASGCGQLVTTNSTIGSAITVSPSYQLSYSSLPFQAANKFEGLTLKRQFGTVFDNLVSWLQNKLEGIEADNAAGNGLPDYLFMSSYNEWIAQPQPNPYASSPYAFSMGLPGDSMAKSLWVDSYGSSLSRDLEPSTAYGSQLYDILSSCLRILNTAEQELEALQSMSGADAIEHMESMVARYNGRPMLKACNVAGEICCAYNATTDNYASVWSITLNTGADALITYDTTELSHLTCPGCGWTQICNPYNGPTDFCVDNSELSSLNALSGPFVLRTGGCGFQTGEYPQSPSAVLENRVPLFRCYSGTAHSIGTAPGCGDGLKTEMVIGCMDTSRTSNMPRALRKCTAANSVVQHVMDGACPAGSTDGGVLGYVH